MGRYFDLKKTFEEYFSGALIRKEKLMRGVSGLKRYLQC